MKEQFAFFINSQFCSGCKTCQVACKDKQDHDPGVKWRRVYEISGGGWQKQEKTWTNNVIAYNLSISCNHCQKPACVSGCPSKALVKNKSHGIVEHIAKKCLGCRYCQWVCPYGAPQYNKKTRTISKCDMCFDRLKVNLLPVCVTACPMRAIEVGPISFLQEKYGKEGQCYPLPRPEITKPALIIKTHPDSVHARKHNSRISNLEEVK